MFTGIVEAVGRIAVKEMKAGDLQLKIASGALSLEDVRLGDSIATNGVCLTVTALNSDGFWADVSQETLVHSSLTALSVGSPVNLEKALTLSTRLGGHLVSGHVDGVGEIITRWPDARSERFRVRAPKALAKYIAYKGSITVDGVSLTVNRVEGQEFELNIVPHTVQETIINHYKAGTKVNIEVDQIARYLERLMMGEDASTSSPEGLTMSLLASNGFINRR